jgi:hypothetical protein
MLNLVEQPGFDYGYPKPNPKFGLWCPLFDCFLMVGHDFMLLSDVQLITNSKILTVLVELDSLTNPNIIDNEVCASWTIQDSNLINFTLIFKKIDSVPKFSICAKVLNNLEEVNQMQVWFTFVSGWVTKLNNNFRLNRAIKFINVVMNIEPCDQVKQQIYKLLLLGNDIELVNQQINHLI